MIIFIIANILQLFLPGIQACAPTSIQPMVPLQPISPTFASQPAPASTPQSGNGRKRRETPKLPFSIRLETNFPYDSRPAKNNQNLLKLTTSLKSSIPLANLPPKSFTSFTKHFDKTANGQMMILLANRLGMDVERCGQFVELGRKAIEATDLLKSMEINCGGNLIKLP